MNYPEYLALAHQLADTSGEVITRYFRKAFNVESKSDATPVTIADREAEAIMRELIISGYPEHGIIGEEFGEQNKEAEFSWVLDPIDGTKSFITGKPLFTTLVALLHKGLPILGIINQPISNERWVGVKGLESRLNGAPIRTSTCSELAEAQLTATSPQMFNGKELPAFERMRQACKATSYGSDAYGYALLANGFIDVVMEANMKPHDYMALIPVIEGAGGIVTDWSGNSLALQGDETVLACANKALHAQALEVIGKVK